MQLNWTKRRKVLNLIDRTTLLYGKMLPEDYPEIAELYQQAMDTNQGWDLLINLLIEINEKPFEQGEL